MVLYYYYFDPKSQERLDDLNLVYKFLSQLPEGLDYFLNERECNLTTLLDKHYSVHSDTNSRYSLLIKKNYEEAFEGYSKFLKATKKRIDKKTYYVAPKDKLHNALKKVGMTGKSLETKLNLLQEFWIQVKTVVKRNLLDFTQKKVREVFKKFLEYLNSVLGSLCAVFNALEPIKEFKEVLEASVNLLTAVIKL